MGSLWARFSKRETSNVESKRVTCPDRNREKITTIPEKYGEEIINHRNAESYADLPLVWIKGHVPRNIARPKIYAVALPEKLLTKHGVCLYYDRASAFEDMRSMGQGRCRVFTNLSDALDYAGVPLEKKKKAIYEEPQAWNAKDKKLDCNCSKDERKNSEDLGRNGSHKLSFKEVSLPKLVEDDNPGNDGGSEKENA